MLADNLKAKRYCCFSLIYKIKSQQNKKINVFFCCIFKVKGRFFLIGLMLFTTKVILIHFCTSYFSVYITEWEF